MRKKRTIIALIAALLMAAAQSGVAQIIVTGGMPAIASLPAGSAVWMHSAGGRFFAALETGDIPASCVILDERGYRGSFYWTADPQAGTLPDGCRILWQGTEGALIKAGEGRAPLPARYHADWLLLDGLSAPAAGNNLSKRTAPAMPSFSGDINTVLDSVSLERIIATVSDLSGETSFTVYNTSYNLTSRYVYSPQIQAARYYLTEELLEMGYATYIQQFQLGAGKALNVNPEFIRSGVAGSGSGLLLGGGRDDRWAPVWHDADSRILTALARPAADMVWATGHRGLLVRFDPATSQARLCSGFEDRDLFDVCFTDDTHGWICGSDGLIAATNDRGDTWHILPSGTDRDLYTLTVAPDGTGWAAGKDGTLLRSRDGGTSWTPLNPGTGSWLYDICFTGRTQGWIAGSQGTLLHTGDGGDTWETIDLPVSVSLLDIDFAADGTGWIAGRCGTLLRTTDSGRTWHTAPAALTGDIYAVSAVNRDTVIAGGYFGLIRSDNGGADFQAAMVPGETFYNVIAEKPGTLDPDITYIICAHYDATNNSGDPMLAAPGADDNASGCAAVLEAARVLAPYTSDYTIKFILFTAEEIGLYGSKAYAQQAAAQGENIAGVINLDMIGYEGDDDLRVELHTNFARTQLVDSMAVWAGAWGLPLAPVKVLARPNSDHAPFLSLGYQALMVIEDTRAGGFNPFYHSANDRLTYMNTGYFHSNVRLAAGTLARFAGIDLTATPVSDGARRPAAFIMHPPWPNPFNPSVTAAIDLPRDEGATVDVFDLLGRPVRRLHQGRLAAGHHTFIWNGDDRLGRPVSSGVYLIVCRTGGGAAAQRKIVLMR
ncbi:M20/M25/M40 family metallo-hydrolase [bacterium]|nr:M20/M25/M40 family metallo-hydrolase [bacterium]